MLPNDDQISQPSQGRYFAFSVGEALAAIKTLGFKHSQFQKRVDLVFRNPKTDSDLGLQVAAFLPSEALVFYSFPLELPRTRCSELQQKAINWFHSVDARVNAERSRREAVSYRAYMGANNRLVLTKRVRSSTLSKYRGGAKFSNAFKPSKVVAKEHVLEEIPGA